MKGGIEKYIYGQASLLPEDKERIRTEAIRKGEDPDEALRMEVEKMRVATLRLQEQNEQNRLKKGRLLNGKFGKESK